MRAAVTGVAGFIGSRLAASLLETGHEVLGIDRMSDYYDPAAKEMNLAALRGSGFEFLPLDLSFMTSTDLARDLDVVFHLAAQPGVRGSWGEGFPTYVRDNILATQRLLECLAQMPEPPRVVYSSSSSIYGNAEVYPTRTSCAPSPLSPYGVTKMAGECLVAAYATGQGVPAVSLRYFTVYGPGQRPDMAIYRIIDAALYNRTFTVLGDGSQIRDFTFVEDVVSANLLSARIELAPRRHEIFNVAGGTEISVRDLIALVGEVVGAQVDVDWKPREPGDPARTKADTVPTSRRLGWRPRTPLPAGIAAQAAWQQAKVASYEVAK
jgi:UDP-glucuronate 4-epimerase